MKTSKVLGVILGVLLISSTAHAASTTLSSPSTTSITPTPIDVSWYEPATISPPGTTFTYPNRMVDMTLIHRIPKVLLAPPSSTTQDYLIVVSTTTTTASPSTKRTKITAIDPVTGFETSSALLTTTGAPCFSSSSEAYQVQAIDPVNTTPDQDGVKRQDIIVRAKVGSSTCSYVMDGDPLRIGAITYNSFSTISDTNETNFPRPVILTNDVNKDGLLEIINVGTQHIYSQDNIRIKSVP